MKDAMLIELAETWELQAATSGDGLNKLHPAACQELRACADTLRMLVSAPPAAPVEQDDGNAWFRLVWDIGQRVDCLASSFPDGNAHILRAIDKLKAAAPQGGQEASAPQPSAVKVPEGWISVEERLPEPDTGEVLVWLTGGRCAFDEWHMHREDPTGMGGPTMDMGLMWRDYDYEDITHWQPLPAAPSAQGDEPSTTPGAKA